MKRYSLQKTHDEQLFLERWNRANNERKAADVLAGLCLGILADGETNSKEASFLRSWLNRFSNQIPSPILTSLLPILDQLADESEIQESLLIELFDLLRRAVGIQASQGDDEMASCAPCDLLFDSKPSAYLSLHGVEIVVSGEFESVSRKNLVRRIGELGGIARESAPTSRTSMIVVGGKGSSQWASANYGTKVDQALLLKRRGQRISILREADFIASIEEGLDLDPVVMATTVIEFPKAAEADLSALPLAGKTFVITGTLTIDRDDMKRLIEEKGGKVSGSISAKTHFLVAGEGGGSKRTKAESLGVTVIDEEATRAMLDA